MHLLSLHDKSQGLQKKFFVYFMNTIILVIRSVKLILRIQNFSLI